MNKDRILKIKLTRYFIQRGWYPQMEVDVLSKSQISSAMKVITDVDVLGLYPDVTGNLNLILGDCKTLKSQSPISRSLWLRGLMDYMKAPKGIIVLQKESEKDHQLTSNEFDVQLLSEKDFDTYSKHTTDSTVIYRSAIAQLENWELFFDIQNKFSTLTSVVKFSRTDFWNEMRGNRKLRSSLQVLKAAKGEFNPAHSLHLALVINHCSLIAISINDIIIKIFHRYVLPKTKAELEQDLKPIIWGGTENYNYLNELRKKFGGDAAADSDLSLPQWDMFIELVRQLLENPLKLSLVPLFLKEVAFEFLSSESYDFSKFLAARNGTLLADSIRIINYVVSACDLPSEFGEIYFDKISNLLATSDKH